MGLAQTLAKLNPLAAVNRQVTQEIDAKTRQAVRSALEEIDAALPALGNLLAGETIEVTATIKVRIGQPQ